MPFHFTMRILTVVAAAVSFGAGAQTPVDEDAMFGNEKEVVLDSSRFNRTALSDSSSRSISANGQPGLKASGGVSMTGNAAFPNSAFRNPDEYRFSSPALQTISVGTLLLDARSEDGTKAFAAIEGEYLSDSSRSNAYLRELFVDFNFRRRIYLRAGKQVVQWGACYFWNPSDLINIERVSFIARPGHLDGTYGVRLHAPIGTRANFYAFLDGNGASNARDVKVSAKGEVLLGKSEFSLSVWHRKDLDPVFAGSVSSLLLGWDLSGEAAFLPRGFTTRFQERGDTLHEVFSEAMTPRISLSLGRSFDFLAINDRIRLQYEMYYNGLGYSVNPLADDRDIPWSPDVELPDGQRVGAGSKALWLLLHERLQPYALGRYYSAFFSSISHFVVPEMTLSCNGIMNMTDRSLMLVSEVSYATLQNLELRFSLVGADGSSRSEYAYSGQGMTAIGSIQYTF